MYASNNGRTAGSSICFYVVYAKVILGHPETAQESVENLQLKLEASSVQFSSALELATEGSTS
jgi:hypothetical protein